MSLRVRLVRAGLGMFIESLRAVRQAMLYATRVEGSEEKNERKDEGRNGRRYVGKEG